MNTQTIKKCDEIIHTAAGVLYKRMPRSVMYYVFSQVEDVHQYGWILLLQNKKIVDLANEDATTHGGFIYKAIYCDLLDHIVSVLGKKNKIAKKEPSKRSALSVDYEKVDFLYVEAKAVEETLSNEIKAFLKKKLSPKELYVANKLFYEGYLGDEIAKTMGVTESRVSQIRTKIVIKLKKFCAGSTPL